jgi:hypothetical protein
VNDTAKEPADVHCLEIAVHRIEHPRGDGMGRALTLECRASGLAVLLDDPADVSALIDDLQKALRWLDENPKWIPE